MRPSFANNTLAIEGAGNAGCAMHPQSRVQNKKAHEVVTTGSPEQPGIPRAMVLTGYFVILCLPNLAECANGRFLPTARRWI
jgi:hypothetical protein